MSLPAKTMHCDKKSRQVWLAWTRPGRILKRGKRRSLVVEEARLVAVGCLAGSTVLSLAAAFPPFLVIPSFPMSATAGVSHGGAFPHDHGSSFPLRCHRMTNDGSRAGTAGSRYSRYVSYANTVFLTERTRKPARVQLSVQSHLRQTLH